MQTSRRNILKSLGLLPIVGAPTVGLLRSSDALGSELRFVADERMPGGRALAATAKNQGLPCIDPRGEIVLRFLGSEEEWLRASGSIIGLTSYTDMMLMSDLARQAGRSLRFAAGRGQARTLVDRLDVREASLVAAIQNTPASRGQASAFVWLV
jgi:hypothetical protein